MHFPRKIYAIQHNVTKRIYIGSTKNVDSRYLNHIYKLRAGKHHIEDMQNDFDVYGEDYSLFILEEIYKWDERIKEYEWMRKYNSFERGIGYNYMDHGKEMACSRNTPPYKEGLPESVENRIPKESLLNLIDKMTECEVIYAYTFLSKLLKNR